jgi:hypothetical protein
MGLGNFFSIAISFLVFQMAQMRPANINILNQVWNWQFMRQPALHGVCTEIYPWNWQFIGRLDHPKISLRELHTKKAKWHLICSRLINHSTVFFSYNKTTPIGLLVAKTINQIKDIVSNPFF